MAMITLAYTVPQGLRPLASLNAQIAAVDVFHGELDLIGATVFSDATVSGVGQVVRTIVLQTTADGDARFPTSVAKRFATRGLYGASIALGTPSRTIASAEPVVV
jgi:hypothetical protein